ncbi:hypothetical protein MIDIC_210002 [Alphaproteobacteria bacterium]
MGKKSPHYCELLMKMYLSNSTAFIVVFPFSGLYAWPEAKLASRTVKMSSALAWATISRII